MIMGVGMNIIVGILMMRVIMLMLLVVGDSIGSSRNDEINGNTNRAGSCDGDSVILLMIRIVTMVLLVFIKW